MGVQRREREMAMEKKKRTRTRDGESEGGGPGSGVSIGRWAYWPAQSMPASSTPFSPPWPLVSCSGRDCGRGRAMAEGSVVGTGQRHEWEEAAVARGRPRLGEQEKWKSSRLGGERVRGAGLEWAVRTAAMDCPETRSGCSQFQLWRGCGCAGLSVGLPTHALGFIVQ